MANYVVRSKIKSLSFLDGYSCESQDKDHFLRHLGHRFSKCCTMGQLNNAYAVNDILVEMVKQPKNNNTVRDPSKPNIINEYWGTFGYILEINHGTVNNPVIETRAFVSDTEAREWVNGQ